MDLRTAFSRRSLLRAGAIATGATLLAPVLTAPHHAEAGPEPRPADRLLFVIAAYGGASIIDSFLPIAANEARAANAPAYPDDLVVQPPGSRIRTVKNVVGTQLAHPFGTDYELSDFVTRHGEDLVVLAHECTSVNHLVAQQRSVTGAGIHHGRTLMEAMAMVHGRGLLLPTSTPTRSGRSAPTRGS